MLDENTDGIPSLGGDDREIREHWARVEATPWHKRDLLNIEEALTRPVSRWGRAIYYLVVPVVVLALIFSNALLGLLF